MTPAHYSDPPPLRGRAGVGGILEEVRSKMEKRRRNQKRKKIRKEVWAVALAEQDGRFLLHRKEGKGLLAGLWQFPIVVLEEKNLKGAPPERETLKKSLKEKFGLRVEVKSLLPVKEHQFTHMHVTMKPFLCSLVKIFPGGPAPKNVRWIRPSSLSRYPISRAMGKIAALILPST